MHQKVFGQAAFEALLLLAVLALLAAAAYGRYAGDSTGGTAPSAKPPNMQTSALPAGAGGAAASSQLTNAVMTRHAAP